MALCENRYRVNHKLRRRASDRVVVGRGILLRSIQPVTFVIAFFAIVGAASKADEANRAFKTVLRVDLGADIGQNSGTLFEALDAKGKPVAGAGFLGAYNTQDRSDRRLVHFYVKLKSDEQAFQPEPLPRPSTDAGTYLYGFDNRLVSFGRSSGTDPNLRVWDGQRGEWQVNKTIVPLSIQVGQGVLAVQPNEVTHAGRVVLSLKSEEGLIAEPYYASGSFVFRRRKPDATPPGNELVACPWSSEKANPIDAATGVALPLQTPGEFVYAYGHLGKKILAATNTGGVHVFDGDIGKWTTLRTPNGVSFQIYAAINFENRLLLGQYPTGGLFDFDGTAIKQLTGQPPIMPGVSPHAREAQTLAIYGGDLYVGVWPWGEVWRLDRRENAWRFLGRMFTHPEPTVATTHPYENETKKLDPVLNRWGQRVTSMVPLGDSLYISTSAKGPNPYEPKFDFLDGDKWKEYGAVYRHHNSGCLAAPFEWKAGPTTFEFEHNGKRLVVFQDGKMIGSTTCELPPVAAVSQASWGEGVFGRFAGKIEQHELAAVNTSRESTIQTASSESDRATADVFLGTYVDMSRCFDAKANVAAREKAIDENLDRIRQAGLNAVIPYANTSSWSVNYPSEIVARKVYGEWDPLAKFVSGARQRGLAVWPAICVCSSGHFEAEGILLDHPEWAIRNPEGKPLGFLSPAHPEARRWLVSVMREIVRKYQPDGVLLDYLRYFNRPWQLDEAAQRALEARLAAESTSDVNEARRREQHYKEEHLTQLAREISEALRAEKPDLKIGIYSWGPHVAKDHRVAQNWKSWVEKGYVDMVNVSGYYYPKQNGEKYLETFASRLSESVKMAAEAGKPVPVTFALGVETSHGKVASARDIEKYLEAAGRAGVKGTAIFTWSTVQPHLEGLAKSGALPRFAENCSKK